MARLGRTFLYDVADVDGDLELDYLSSKLGELNLKTSTTFVVTDAFANRPDLISFKFYKNHDFGWLIALHNNMIDPINEMDTGVEIDIPSIEEYYRFNNRYARRT